MAILNAVNVWPIADTTGYGPAQTAVTNTAGNTLVAYVACGSDNVAGEVPRMFIADDAHNYWEFQGTRTDSFTGTVRRIDIWICRNAYAATVVSVGASMVYAGLAGQIVEFTGFPAFTSIDFINVNSASGTTSSRSVTVGAGGPDFVLTALLTAGAAPGPVTVTPTWSSVACSAFSPSSTGSAAGDMSELSVYAAYWAGTQTGTNTITWTWTNSTNYNVITIGFSSTTQPPSQQNPSWPAMKFEAAFGFQPGNVSGAMPSWTDLTSRVFEESGQVALKTARGREYELTQPEAGSLEMPLNNVDGAFNPDNTSSPFYPNVIPEVPVRASAVWQAKTYGLGYVYAQKWPQDFPDPQWGMTGFEGGDAIGIASQGQMPSAYQAEVLADLPQGAWTLGEFYSAPNGFTFANFSRTNQKPMIGYSPSNLGTSLQLQTGQPLNMAGDTSSGIGLSGLTSYSTAGGGGAFIRDPNLPGGSLSTSGMTTCTYDFWCVPTYGQPTAGLSEAVDLLAVLGTPTNYPPVTAGAPFPNNNGARLIVNAWFNTPASGNNYFAAQLLGPAGQTIATIASANGTLKNANLYHIAVKTSYNGSGTWTLKLYINGVQAASGTGSYTGSLTCAPLPVLVGGPCAFMGGDANTDNYTVGQIAAYPWLVPDARLLSHYNTGSLAGSGDQIDTRVAKLFTWSGMGLPFGAGLPSPSPLMGFADSISGSALADALYNAATTEGGMYYAPATAVGEVWYQPRVALYNQLSSLTFGDNPVYINNGNPGFLGNGQGWVPNGCSKTGLDPDTGAPGGSSLTLTSLGSITQFLVRYTTPASNANSYTLFGYAKSATTNSNFGMSIDWYGTGGYISTSSTGNVLTIPGGNVWTPFSFTVPAASVPAGTISAQYGPTLGGNPALGVAITVADFWLSSPSSEIPYETNSGFDFSDTFLYNLVSSQRTISAGSGYITGPGGQAELATFNSYGVTAITADPTSEAEYFIRGPLQQDIETTSDQDAYDRANWSLVKYKQPQLRANQILLNPAGNPVIFAAALSVEQGDIVTVIRRPTGAAAISVLCIVQQVKHDIGPDTWTTTITLAPYYPEGAVAQLDNTAANTLANRVLPW